MTHADVEVKPMRTRLLVDSVLRDSSHRMTANVNSVLRISFLQPPAHAIVLNVVQEQKSMLIRMGAICVCLGSSRTMQDSVNNVL